MRMSGIVMLDSSADDWRLDGAGAARTIGNPPFADQEAWGQ